MATLTAVAGGGNWSAGATWDTGNAPTSADDVRLAASSGNVTIDANVVCRSLDCTGYTGTLTHNAFTLTIGDASGGALKLVTGMTYAPANANRILKFVATSDNGGAGWGITSAGKTLGGITFDGVGGKWVCQDSFTTRTNATVTLTNGTWDTNGKAISLGAFTCNGSGVRTLAMAGSAVTITGVGTVWSLGGTGSFTFTGPATLAFTDASASTKAIVFSSLVGFSLAYNAVSFAGGGAGSISFRGPLATFTSLTFGANQTYLLTGDMGACTTLAINGAAGSTVTFTSDIPGTVRALTILTAGTATYTTLQDVNCNANASILATDHCTNNGNNHNVVFATPKRLTLAGVG